MPIVLALSLVVLQVLIVIVHLAVYAVMSAFFLPHGFRLYFQVFFILLAFTFTSASFLGHWFRGKFVSAYYTFAAYWFGLAHFLFGGVVVFFFAANFLYSSNHYVSPALLAGASLGVFFLLHLYGTWKSGWAEITRIDAKLPNLPEAWRGKNIVFISDLHLGNVRGVRFVKKVARKIQALAPEAVLIGGDLYDGVRCETAAIIEPLRALHAPKGIYFITGNHEYFLKDLDEALLAIKALGIRILNNESIDLQGIQLIGVDYKTTRKSEALAAVLKNIGVMPGRPSVLLKHEPNHLEVARDAGVSFTLSGHTHRGQIFPLNFFTRQIYKGFDYGLKRLGDLRVYTSSGAGTWGPPLRLGTKSEIVLVTFR
jgi:predicted MPP superfamily phosphohydrolase